MAVPVVGVTGGIACGKSTVTRRFAALGVPVVDADAVAREVVAPGTDGLAAVVDAFGEGVLSPDGALDRKALAALVFGDAEARRRLEGILHPRIAAESGARFRALQGSGAPYLVYEAALLVETGRHRDFAALVVVAASPETQLERLVARDGEGEEAARRRIAAQMPVGDKVAVADHVIWNDGSIADVDARVDAVHEALLRRFEAAR